MEYSTSLIILDSFVRISGITLLLFLIFSLIPYTRNSNSIWYLLLSCISLLGLFIGLVPDYVSIPKTLYIVARLIDIPHLVFIWLFALSLFHYDFRLSRFYIVVAVIYCLPILLVRFAQFDIFSEIKYSWVLIANNFSFLLMAHLIFVALKGRSDDLSEKRRFSRICFVVVIGAIAILTAINEIWMASIQNEYVGTFKTTIIFCGIVLTCFWLLHFNINIIAFESLKKSNTVLTDKEILLISKLEEAMKNKKLYLDHTLTIESLANSLHLPIHKLRQLINQKLGYKNFSAFVNGYRIDDIKEILSDPAKLDLPILTIALNNGFASLSPFNRAFLAKEGITPSEYRNLRIKENS